MTTAPSRTPADPETPALASASSDPAASAEPWLQSQTHADEDQLVLIHEVHLRASPDAVWAAHTTTEGWEAWAAPVAAVDLRVGGTIQTHYGPGAAIGDPGTTTLHIVNYAEPRLLTLQAEPSPSWPPPFQADAQRMYNVILFEPLPEGGTRVVSFGLGYRDTPEHRQILDFFEQANEGLYAKLRAYVEHGERATFPEH